MRSADVANHRRSQTILQLTDDGSFKRWCQGDIATVDRFLSNFHKPLQRRMLHISPNQDMPELGVVKVKGTGDIYLISEPRDDSEKDKAYDRICVLHLVSGRSGQLCEVFNYEPSEDHEPEDTGLLIKNSKGQFYIAIEHVSGKSAEYSDELFEGKSVAYCPNNCPLIIGSMFTHTGDQYRVVDTFEDTGYACAIILKLDDDFQQLTYSGYADTGSGYDVATGTITRATKSYLFTGSVDLVSKSMEGESTYTVYSKSVLPFSFEYNGEITLASGKTLYVRSWDQDTNAKGQIKIKAVG